MKTDFRKKDWLRRVAVVLLAVAGSLTVAAQEIEGGEAFYIYQNDGHFDGFFYDQVKQIRFSRFDTLGIERNEYVSQEIVTADSTYRIMLTAIDSVSFTQPEIRFAKGVRFMRDEGMMDYFKAYAYDESQKHVLNFDLSMPETLRPKVGDVLSCDSVTGYTDGAFVYKVTSVRQSGQYLQALCEHVTDLKDVFEQFITIEQVRNIQTPEGSRTRRRVAGWNAPKKIEGNIDEFTLFNINTGFELEKKLFDKLSFKAAVNVNFGMTLSSVYNISLTNWYFKHEMKEQFGIGANFGFDGELFKDVTPSDLAGSTALANFTRIPIPANFPIFYVAAMPEPFARIEAHLTLMFNTGFKAIGLAQRIESMETFPYVNLKFWSVPPFLPIPGEWETDKDWSVNAQLNGFVQAGINFPVAVGSQEWFNKIFGFKSGVSVYAGPKVSGALDLALITNDSNKGYFSKQYPKGWYEKLKGTKVDLSLFSFDPDFKAEVKAIGGVNWDYKSTTSFSFGNYTLHLFPTVKDFSLDITGERMNTITARAGSISGEVFLPQRVGFALYKPKDKDDEEYTELYRYVTRDETYFLNTFNSFDLQLENIPPGVYKAFPMVNLPFGVFPIEPLGQVVTISPFEMELKVTEIQVEEDGGQFDIEIAASLDFPFTCEPSDSWIKAEVLTGVGSMKSIILKITVDPNDTDAFRTGTVTVRQHISATEIIERTVTVMQYGGLQLSPSLLTIPKEGGTKTVNILTSMDPITIDLNDGKDWLEYDLQKRTLTITASENASAPRTATVIVSAWSSRHNGFNATKLTVRQEGAVNASVQPSALTFQPNGGTQQVSVTLGAGVTLTGATVSEDAKDWLIVEKGTSYVNITAMPNTVAQQRQGTIYCEVTKDDTGEMVEMPVSVTQEMSTASISPASLLFAASGGVQQAHIDKGSFAFCDVLGISDEGKGWVSATADTDGTVNVTVEANGLSVQRECTVNCWVSSVKSPSYEEMMILPLKVIQEPRSALEPVTPDGDKSPFSYISFTAERFIEYVSASEGKVDTIVRIMPSFAFKPDNAHFTVKYGKDINHYECVGYQEWASNDTKTRATLSFDVEKKTDKVKNVRYVQDSESHLSITVWGATGHLTSNASMALTVNEFPLEVNGRSYKHGKYAIADGLLFSSFNGAQDARTTYTLSELGKEFYGEEGLDPVSDHFTFLPYNDPRDYVEIYISYKEGQGEPIDMEWPSSEVLASLKEDGMPIYEGENPPEVSGTYQLSPFKLVADPTGNVGAEMVESGLDGIVLKFSGQADGEVSVSMYYTAEGVASVADDEMKGLITGNGNQFSICVPDGYGGANIISGVIDNGAISNLHFAFCDMKKAGQHVVLSDDDGYSSTTTWSPGNDEARRIHDIMKITE